MWFGRLPGRARTRYDHGVRLGRPNWIPLTIAALGSLAVGVSFSHASEGPGPVGPVLEEAYDLAYNLDHDQAVKTLMRALDADPDDASAHRGIAAMTWLRMLFLRGQVLVDSQMTATLNSSGKKQDPPEEMDEVFRTHIAQAVALSEDAVRQTPDDPEAHYQLGASLALIASYTATIEGEGLRALRDAKRAYTEHEKVLDLDPTRKDANLTLGLYRYLVSLLPGPVRMMAYLVGFDGGREEALRLVEEAAAYPGDSQAEAKFALVLLYNREKDFDHAQRVLAELKQRYPRNRLVWLESASTWLRDDRAMMAERELQLGFAKLLDDDRTRMFGEEEVWLLKRGTARVELEKLEDARLDLEGAQTDTTTGWVKGRAAVELGKIADLEGDRSLASSEYDRGRKLCDRANDRRCVSLAKSLKKYGYSAN